MGRWHDLATSPRHREDRYLEAAIHVYELILRESPDRAAFDAAAHFGDPKTKLAFDDVLFGFAEALYLAERWKDCEAAAGVARDLAVSKNRVREATFLGELCRERSGR